jgi:hypothetical protein
VNAPGKAIRGVLFRILSRAVVLASLVTAQKAKSGLTAARPVSRRNCEGENHGHICLCQIISARDTAVCPRRFPEPIQHQMLRATRRCTERHRDRIALPSCLFSQQIQNHARGILSFLFFSFLSSSFRKCLEKRRGSSPFTLAVVYPESFRALFHSPIA